MPQISNKQKFKSFFYRGCDKNNPYHLLILSQWSWDSLDVFKQLIGLGNLFVLFFPMQSVHPAKFHPSRFHSVATINFHRIHSLVGFLKFFKEKQRIHYNTKNKFYSTPHHIIKQFLVNILEKDHLVDKNNVHL